MLMYSYSQEDSLCSVVLQKRGILHNAVSVIRGILFSAENSKVHSAPPTLKKGMLHIVDCCQNEVIV
jgi:hypothetical protein